MTPNREVRLGHAEPRTIRHRFVGPSLGLILVVGLVACGGDDDADGPAIDSGAIESRASDNVAAAWYQQGRSEIGHIQEAIAEAVNDITADPTRCSGYSPLLAEVSESPLNDSQRAHQTWLDVVGAFTAVLARCREGSDGVAQAATATSDALARFDEWTAALSQAT